MHTAEMKQVDVRKIQPRDRHPMIFETFDQLEVGESFELLNDHDPRPLQYQFDVERPGEFAWEYLQKGPELWKVKLSRVSPPQTESGGCCGGCRCGG